MDYYKQEKDYTCGCACVRMVLSQFEPSVADEGLMDGRLDSKPNAGTDPKKIVDYLTRHGYEVVRKDNSSIEVAQEYFKAGYAVLMEVSVDVPHFTIYRGHNKQHVKFFDPFFGEIHRPLKKFAGDKVQHPNYRWRVTVKDFEKLTEYDFTGKDSYKAFMAIKPVPMTKEQFQHIANEAGYSCEYVEDTNTFHLKSISDDQSGMGFINAAYGLVYLEKKSGYNMVYDD